MKAGKDVCCEKPTLTIEQGRILADQIKKHNRIFQTSLEDRSYKQYLRMAELVRNGRIGKLRKLRAGLPGEFSIRFTRDTSIQPVPKGFDYDMWLGPAPWKPYCPGRCHWNFRWINDYSGGSLADWGAHIIDTAQWINGTEKWGPVELEVHSDFVEIYAEGTDGWLLVKGWNKELQASSPGLPEYEFSGDDMRLYTAENEFENFLDCVVSRKQTYHPAEDMHRTSTIAHMGNIAMILKRKLRWDPEKEEFPGDREANSMRSKEERAPWILRDLIA